MGGLKVEHKFQKPAIKSIISIIDNISFSKEYNLRKNNKTIELDENTMILRNIVSDADKIESVGKKGIERMIDFRIYQDNTEIANDVQKHFKNKFCVFSIINFENFENHVFFFVFSLFVCF